MTRRRPFEIFVEFPVRKNHNNLHIVNKLRSFPTASLNGIVFSDKAGGLDHFCETEDLIYRGVIADVKKSFNHPLQIWNVIRTGDRCASKLIETTSRLIEQGTDRIILVSGHGYRSVLSEMAKEGHRCTKLCSNNQASTILCGRQSSDVFADEHIMKQIRMTKGAILHGSETELGSKQNADFYITQALPITNPRDWINPLLHMVRGRPMYATVIPVLSSKELHRIRALGSQINPQQVALYEGKNERDAKQVGLRLAQDAIDFLFTDSDTAGVYLYHHNFDVLANLVEYINDRKQE